MQRASTFFFSLVLCGTLGLSAQTLTPPQKLPSPDQPKTYDWTLLAQKPMARMSACPVDMRARQGTGSGLLVARDNKNQDKVPRSGQPSQRIHLILRNGQGKHIVQATVIVRGFGSKGRMEHVLASTGDATTLSRTLMVRMRSEDKDTVAGDLVLLGFTSVQTIELRALRYDDGSSWNALLHSPCSVTPDPLMLIAGR